MKNEKSITNDFINYLKEHSYPEKSIAMQFSYSRNSHIDIAIIDNVTNVPIQLFEIKSNINEEIINSAIRQINDYRKTLQNTDIPAYLVTSHNESPFFEIRKINGEKAEAIDDLTSELNYEAQKYARVSEGKRNVVAEQKSSIDGLKRTSRIIAIVISIIIVAEKIANSYFQLSLLDLYFLLTIIVLLLLPYYKIIKFYGVEFKRLSSGDECNNK